MLELFEFCTRGDIASAVLEKEGGDLTVALEAGGPERYPNVQ